ncbi:hypothetical protein BGL73_06600 [Helicobacter pylori]|nr:hypothetical protein BGL73_06600 [Helicobacter pylori]
MLIPFYFRFLDYILKRGLIKVIDKLWIGNTLINNN